MVVVTAADEVTTKTYTITATRAPSSNASLSALTISTGALSPGFATGPIAYSVSESSGTASVTIKPTTTSIVATVKVNGITVTSGTSSGSISLPPGTTNIPVEVTAQDGTTKKTYTIAVTRGSGGSNAFIPLAAGTGISVTKPIETPALAEDGIAVHQGLSPNGDGINDFLQIDNISQYPDNKLTIMNRSGQLIYEAKGYDNSSKTFDGHSNKNGKMQSPGTYFYQLDYTVNGVTKHKTGFIVLKY